MNPLIILAIVVAVLVLFTPSQGGLASGSSLFQIFTGTESQLATSNDPVVPTDLNLDATLSPSLPQGTFDYSS
jgi:hypothetical protein